MEQTIIIRLDKFNDSEDYMQILLEKGIAKQTEFGNDIQLHKLEEDWTV